MTYNATLQKISRSKPEEGFAEMADTLSEAARKSLIAAIWPILDGKERQDCRGVTRLAALLCYVEDGVKRRSGVAAKNVRRRAIHAAVVTWAKGQTAPASIT